MIRHQSGIYIYKCGNKFTMVSSICKMFIMIYLSPMWLQNRPIVFLYHCLFCSYGPWKMKYPLNTETLTLKCHNCKTNNGKENLWDDFVGPLVATNSAKTFWKFVKSLWSYFHIYTSMAFFDFWSKSCLFTQQSGHNETTIEIFLIYYLCPFQKCIHYMG